MTDIEDRGRRNNVRLVGLPEGAEGTNAAGFLRVNLSKWIPSLRGRDIEIDRAHRMYDGGRGSDQPRTLIFRLLRWHDRSEILKGARQAYPVKCAQDNVTLLFFPDFSPATAGGGGGGQRPLSLRPGGRSLMAGMDMVLAAQGEMVAGWTWTLARPVFCFFFSPLSYWDIVPIYPVQRSRCW